MASNKDKFDGYRGRSNNKKTNHYGRAGWWISLEEAREYAIEDWWMHDTITSTSLSVKQYDSSGPPDKPVWMYENGDMFLGRWTKVYGVPAEHGFGAGYIHNPDKFRGIVYVGEWKEGSYHGSAKAFWLESARTWIKNQLGDSGIRQYDGTRNVSRPYTYTGNYVDNVETDQSAIVTLKDGTTRIGPWEAGKPVGDWWNDHQSAASLPANLHQPAADSPPLDVSTSNSRQMPCAWRQQEKRSARKAHVSRRNVKATTASRKSVKDRRPMHEQERAVTLSRAHDQERLQTVGTGTQETREHPREEQQRDPPAEESQMKLIAMWLHDVIGYNPDQEQMEYYAKQFIELGLHSPLMIRDLLPANRVVTFAWMKEFHRQQFLSNANLQC